jgi:DNA topoisomerase IB
VGFSYRQSLVADEVQADDFRHWAGSAIAEMAADSITHHLPKVFESIALSGDGMT